MTHLWADEYDGILWCGRCAHICSLTSLWPLWPLCPRLVPRCMLAAAVRICGFLLENSRNAHHVPGTGFDLYFIYLFIAAQLSPFISKVTAHISAPTGGGQQAAAVLLLCEEPIFSLEKDQCRKSFCLQCPLLPRKRFYLWKWSSWVDFALEVLEDVCSGEEKKIMFNHI